MKCKICNKEVFSAKDGKEPRAYMSVKPLNADDVRCEEHRNE